MQPKKFFFIFAFGFLLLLPLNFTKADGACFMGCGYCGSDSSTCRYTRQTDLNTESVSANRLGLINSPGYISCPNSWHNASGGSCVEIGNSCKQDAFPSGTHTNGQSCTAIDSYFSLTSGCNYGSATGVWDANNAKCVTCSGAKENNVLGDAGDIYFTYNTNNTKSYGSGDGKCESACGADAACDERSPGDACGTGTCSTNCTCVPPCTSGGCCDTSTNTLKAAGIYYSDYTCSSPCTKTRTTCTCTGTSASCTTGTDSANVADGKVCSLGNEIDPTSVNYCGTVTTSCAAGSCSGHKYYHACNGSGSCYGSGDTTHVFNQTIYADNGYTLTASCGTQGTGYCATDQCVDSVLPGFKCLMRCNADHNCFSRASCSTHCSNNTQDCDETGVDAGGSCAICSSSLTVSASSALGNGTCTVTASISASACAGKSWNIKDSGGTVPDNCLGTASGASYTGNCSWSVGFGTYTYKLFIDDVQQDVDKQITCSNTSFVFAVSTSPISGSVSPGNSVSTAVSIAFISGSPDSVSLAVSNLLSGISASISPTGSCTPTTASPCLWQITIQVPAATPLGYYPIYINGTGGGQTYSVTYGLSVDIAITQPAVNLGTADAHLTSAILRGTLEDLGNAASCSVWFEWGTSHSYGHATPIQTLTSPGPFSAYIISLLPGTKYYFRAKAKCGGSW